MGVDFVTIQNFPCEFEDSKVYVFHTIFTIPYQVSYMYFVLLYTTKGCLKC